MLHDPLALLLHVGDAFAPMFRHAPGFEARLTGESWFASAGEGYCLWNWVGVTSASPACVATLREAVARCRERRVEGLACYPPAAADALAGTRRALGLGEPGAVPLMVCDAADVPAPASTDITVERVTSPELLAGVIAVVSTSFEIPPEQTARVLTAGVLDEPAVAIYAARRGRAVAGAITTTRFGSTVSIDIMAVDPTRQRQGIGRALMLAAMHDQIAAGATGFHLLSSTEGKRLYDQVGFTTLLSTITRFIPIDPIPADQVVL